MKSDMAAYLGAYLERHPGRTITPIFSAIDKGMPRYEVRMEDGRTVVVYPGEMFPE